MTKTLTIAIEVTGTEEEIKTEINLILRLISASNFSRINGHSVIQGQSSYGLIHPFEEKRS